MHADNKDNDIESKNGTYSMTCPYCEYQTDILRNFKGEIVEFNKEDTFFCYVCANTSILDRDMKLIKLDINSIEDLTERNRIKDCQIKLEKVLDKNIILSKKREEYLMNRDKIKW